MGEMAADNLQPDGEFVFSPSARDVRRGLPRDIEGIGKGEGRALLPIDFLIRHRNAPGMGTPRRSVAYRWTPGLSPKRTLRNCLMILAVAPQMILPSYSNR